MKLNFGVTSDLVQIGVNEDDGEPVIREAFYVFAEDEQGYRWAHQHTFCTKQGRDPQGDAARAQALCDRITASGSIDFQYWTEIDPCYGSPAYIKEGVEEQRWLEERMEALGL